MSAGCHKFVGVAEAVQLAAKWVRLPGGPAMDDKLKEVAKKVVAAFDKADEAGMFAEHPGDEGGKDCLGCQLDIVIEELREASN